jgi:molybdopterin/thiamine biosynthesis adenylyltransferase
MRVILVDRPPFLTWPHVERDGALCILPEIAEVNGADPAAATANVLGRGSRLIEESITGANEEDFRAEFCSYWEWDRSEACVPVRSLLSPAGATRTIRVWRGRAFYLLGDDETAIAKWLGNLSDAPKSVSTEAGFLLWIDRPLLPAEYPRSGRDVIALARRVNPDAAVEIERMAADSPNALVVAIGANSSNGPCFAAVNVAVDGGRRGGSLRNGFRAGRIPESIASKRFFSAGKVIRSPVQRVDPAWVHGRSRDPRFARLREARVVILGCGSIGGPVALAFAASGVGRVVLCDPDPLSWANVGRHPLGAESVGVNKAQALAKQLRRSYPHIEVEAYPTCWEDLPGGLVAPEFRSDLIVSAIGSWASEGMLNEWHVLNGRQSPLIYGWTEPHACAGHAVAITNATGCLECGFDDAGAPRLRVCCWDSETTLQEPACGAVFQPYGPVELAHIIAMIAELGVDCLLGTVATPTHRIWIDRRRRLTELGGRWSPEWTVLAGDRMDGGFLYESPWTASGTCRVCQLPPAA